MLLWGSLLLLLVVERVVDAWDVNGAWQLCIGVVCRSRPLDVSSDPDRCSEFDRRKFAVSSGALCLSQGSCKRKCSERADCHHVQTYVNEEVCYLKPLACEADDHWYADQEYFAFVKSDLTVGCPEQPLSRPPSTLATTAAPLAQRDGEELVVFHTPSPLAIPAASQETEPVTLSFHTPAPIVAPPTARSSWSHREPPVPQEPVKLSFHTPAPMVAPSAAAKSSWPHGRAPQESLTNPGDRWYVRLGKRCVQEGLNMEGHDDQCFKHPGRNGFVGSFRSGRSAICLDVNRCMQLCDKTQDCHAVEMSQVDRCQLKPAGCLSEGQWEPDASTNLVVLSHSSRTTSSTTTELVLADRPRTSGVEVLLRAAKIIANNSLQQVRRDQLEESNQDEVQETRLKHLASLMHFSSVDLPDGSHQSFKYSSSVLRGCTLYLVPFNAENVGIFDTATKHFRTVSLPSGMMGGSKYSAGVMAEGGTAYFVPYAADNIGVFDVHKEDFRTIDISAETSADCKYSGALVSDGIAYFIPSSASNVGVFNPTTESFRAVPLPNPSSIPWKYRGGVILERTCYFAPHNADDIGMFDIDSLSFRSLDISGTISIGRKFSDAFEHNGAVYFVPFNADAVGVLEIETEHFLLLDIATSISRNFKYWGAVPDRGLAYLVPYDADSIGVLHLDSESFVTIDISGKINADSKWFSSGILVNGAVYFIPGSAGSIGILQVDRGDPACHHDTEHVKRKEEVRVAGAGHGAALRRHGQGPPHSQLADLLQSASPVLSAVGSDSFLASAVLVGAVICALLTRGSSSKFRSLQPLLSGTLAVCVSALLFFVLRGGLDLLRQRHTPFWEELLPAMGFFLGLYGLLQVMLLQDRSEDGSESLVLERPLPEAMMVCSGYIVLFTAVDAGGALEHFFGGSPLQVALSLPCFQLVLLGLDRLAGTPE
ncbi:unnamed protein product [Symbiodinium sp. CCMP2592]|nr:unnamed protein product [Symbiodinium sp. CCMP2592]